MMAAIGITLIGILAGWLVNVIADTVPARRTLRDCWQWPFQQLGLIRSHAGPEPVDAAAALPPAWRYLLVWLVALCLGWFAYTRLGWTVQALLVALEAWFFLAIAVIDLEHRLVLNRMLMVAGPAIVIANLLINTAAIGSTLFGGAVGFGLFLILALLVPGGIGMGDVKLAGLIGLTIGLSSILVALFIAIMTGGIAGALILIKSRFQRGQTMAYAPYLVVGVWFVLFDGIELLHSYLERL